MRLLLDSGADPNMTDRDGTTPLEAASLKGADTVKAPTLSPVRCSITAR